MDIYLKLIESVYVLTLKIPEIRFFNLIYIYILFSNSNIYIIYFKFFYI